MALAFLVAVAYEEKQRWDLQSRSLDRRQDLLESAPVPPDARMTSSGPVGDTGYWCLASPGCSDPDVEVVWRMPQQADCDAPTTVARAWRMEIAGTGDCMVYGEVDGRPVSVRVDTGRDLLIATG